MKKIIKYVSIVCCLMVVAVACQKEDYSFGDIKTPTELSLAATIVGSNTSNPNGNGTGSVDIVVSAKDAITYQINYGDGKSDMISTGTISHKYAAPGTNKYLITVNAIGTAGVQSTITKEVTVFVAFEIPTDIVSFLTNGTNKTWISAKETPGHFGVGPTTEFSPIWYAAAPNERSACVYDDEITFTKNSASQLAINVDNKGESFLTGAAAGFYGFSGGDNCYPLNTGGTKILIFSGANSGSNASNSTGVQFEVPGNGIVNSGTGGNTYEILKISATQLTIRNIGTDGNAWFQTLKAK